MISRPVLPSLVSLVLAAAVGCSSAPETAPAPAATTSPPPGPVGTDAAAAVANPALHFIDASGKEVTSILYTDVVTVRIDGLVAGKTVKVDAVMKPWASSVTFVAGAD